MIDVNIENVSEILKEIRQVSGHSRRDLAKILGATEATITRLENKETFATDEFINRLKDFLLLKEEKFLKMVEGEKSDIPEKIGAAGGAVAGIGSALGAVGAAGAVGGFSAAGMTSGLAALGGGMLAGIGVVAVAPALLGVGGYYGVKKIKEIVIERRLDSKDIDPANEFLRDSVLANLEKA